MKKVLKPVSPEECVYYSDFSGLLLENSSQYGPPIEMVLRASYGSQHDGNEVTLHLSDKDLQTVTKFLRELVTEDFKRHSTSTQDSNSILTQITN